MARNLIVINVDFKETRVALIEEGVIAELQIERAAHRSTVGNIVLGRVTRVLPGMQAAFIDVGQERAAFLHVEDLIRPDDFDAYLAADVREKVKLKSADDSTGEASGEEAETPSPEVLPAEALDSGGRTSARRGRRRRGRRGRGRERLPGAAAIELDGTGAEIAEDAGEDVGEEADELDSLEGNVETPEMEAPIRTVAEIVEDLDDRVQFHGHSGVFDDIEFGEAQEDSDAEFDDEDPNGDGELEYRDLEGEEEADEGFDEDELDDDLEAEETEDLDDDLEAEETEDLDDEDELDDDLDTEELEDEAEETEDLEDDAEDDLETEDGFDADETEDLDDEDDVDDEEEERVELPGAIAAEGSLSDAALAFEVGSSSEPGGESAPRNASGPVTAIHHEVDTDIAPESGEEAPYIGQRVSETKHVSPEGERVAAGAEAMSEAQLPVERPSHVQLVPPSEGQEEQVPPSGERELSDVLPAADEGEADDDFEEAGEEPAGVDGETEVLVGGAEVSPDEGRRRRGRRRRRRGGRDAREVVLEPTAPVAAAAAEPRLPNEPAHGNGNASSADSDANRRGRRRRGRRRGGVRPDVKTTAIEAAPASVSDTARRMPLRVSRSVPITEVVREGDLVVVQISKEPIGTKGARVTSHVSLPGRYVVYLPTVDHIGISKRIGNARERARLRKSIEAIKPANGGLIVRTVAEGLTKKQLKADIGYLIKVWADVARRRETAKSAEVLYEELDLVLKAARDLFTDEVQQIVIDDREQHGRLCRFVEMFMPGRVKDIKLYSGEEPVFDAYGIEDEIKRALSRKVPLPSGGSLIMDQAEALTAIDVNTGRYVGKGSKDLEETALKTNLEAVDEIAYQLRFRNIGGLVILDLIDMERADNRDKVWRALEQKLAKDKAKTTINRISDLGLIEMTRKRTRESLGRIMHEPCFYCDGTGNIQSRETIAYEILRQIRRDRMSLTGYSVRVLAHPAVVDFLKHEARDALLEAERRYLRRIELVPKQEYHIEQYDLQGR